jgi:phosphate uptake regulator
MTYLRKVLKIGNSSLFITLPKPWCEKYSINEGDIVEALESSTGELMLVPRKKEESEKTFYVNLEGLQSSYIEKILSYAYINGYTKLRISYKNKKMFEDLKDLVESKFMGLILVSENDNEAVFSFALDTNQVDFYEIIRRMDRITSFMIDSISDRDKVKVMDAEVDKLYFLLIRMLRTGLTDSAIAKKLMLSPVQFLDYRLVLHFIETIGDELTCISGKIRSERLEAVKKLKEISIKAFLGDRKVKPSDIEQVSKEAYSALESAGPQVALNISRIIEMAKDIADLSETLYLV